MTQKSSGRLKFKFQPLYLIVTAIIVFVNYLLFFDYTDYEKYNLIDPCDLQNVQPKQIIQSPTIVYRDKVIYKYINITQAPKNEGVLTEPPQSQTEAELQLREKEIDELKQQKRELEEQLSKMEQEQQALKDLEEERKYQPYIAHYDGLTEEEYNRLDDWYAKNFVFFTNSADFDINRHLFSDICRLYLNTENENNNENQYNVFMIGTNGGQAIINILKNIPQCTNNNNNEKLQIYSWETKPNKLNKAKNRLERYFSENTIKNDIVKLNDGLISDTMGTKDGQPMITLDSVLNWDVLENIDHIDYVTIDGSGHDSEIVLGMNLVKNYKKFAMIQLTLGGTWVDERHSKFEWRQGDLLRYLQSMEYRLYLMGVIEVSFDEYMENLEQQDRVTRALTRRLLENENTFEVPGSEMKELDKEAPIEVVEALKPVRLKPAEEIQIPHEDDIADIEKSETPPAEITMAEDVEIGEADNQDRVGEMDDVNEINQINEVNEVNDEVNTGEVDDHEVDQMDHVEELADEVVDEIVDEVVEVEEMAEIDFFQQSFGIDIEKEYPYFVSNSDKSNENQERKYYVPFLIHLYPSMIDNTRKYNSPFAQGNVLAIHWDSIVAQTNNKKDALFDTINHLVEIGQTMINDDLDTLPQQFVPNFRLKKSS